jgi:Na+/melibiose symporter-like transporter
MFYTVLDDLLSLLGGDLSFKIVLTRSGAMTTQITSRVRPRNWLVGSRYTVSVVGIFRLTRHFTPPGLFTKKKRFSETAPSLKRRR